MVMENKVFYKYKLNSKYARSRQGNKQLVSCENWSLR